MRSSRTYVFLVAAAFMGSTATALALAAQDPVYFGGDVANSVRQRPARIHLTSDQNILHIRWSTWGGRTAQGHGRLEFSASDMHAPEGVALGLSVVRRCSGKRRYMRLAVRSTTRGMPDHFVVRYSCRSPFG